MFDSIQKESKPLTNQVSEQIIQLIQDSALNIGEKLPNEFELAERLQVGRGTIREAVKLLVSRNILEIRRGKGTFVTESPGIADDPLGLNFFKDKKKMAADLMEIRCMVEPQIASLAAERATEEDIVEMHRLCDEIEGAMCRGESHRELDVELHTAIARSSQNLIVPNLIPIITTGIAVFIDLTNRSLLKETIIWHEKIVKAIEERNPEEAYNAMLRHLTDNKYILDDSSEAPKDKKI